MQGSRRPGSHYSSSDVRNVRLLPALPAPALVVQRKVEMKRALSIIAGVSILVVTIGVETSHAQSYTRHIPARAFTPQAYPPQSRSPVRREGGLRTVPF